MRDGIPIGLGYFAVSFSLGIIAKECGFSVIQGILASLTTYASAGQYLGFTLYMAEATIIELILMTIITNARYLLMGLALNQRTPQDTSIFKRILIGITITDEIFGITIARPGVITPWYGLGAMIVSIPLWSIGTALGIYVGNILPVRLMSAFSVALFGMFIAVFIPPSRKDKKVALFVGLAFVMSFICTYAPYVSELSSGNRTIILTVVLSSAAALIFPIKDHVIHAEKDEMKSEPDDLDEPDIIEDAEGGER